MTMMSAATMTQPVTQPKMRAKGPHGPHEGRAAVRVDFVQIVVRARYEQHRDEGHDDDGGRLHTHAGDHGHEPERGGQTVCGRGRGDTDDDAREQSDRLALEPLVRFRGEISRLAPLPFLHCYPLLLPGRTRGRQLESYARNTRTPRRWPRPSPGCRKYRRGRTSRSARRRSRPSRLERGQPQPGVRPDDSASAPRTG